MPSKKMNTIINQDCIEGIKKLSDESINLIVAEERILAAQGKTG